MKLHIQEFQTGQVCEATGVTRAALNNYIRRNLIIGHKETQTDIKGGGGSGAGNYRRYSFHNVMEIAIASELMSAGMAGDAKAAFWAAKDFAHVSGGGKTFGLPEREPGFPYHFNHGYTIFAVSGGRTCEDIWKPGENYDTYGKIRHHLKGKSFIAIDATEVFDQVCGRLGIHPNKAMDAAYPQEAS